MDNKVSAKSSVARGKFILKLLPLVALVFLSWVLNLKAFWLNSRVSSVKPAGFWTANQKCSLIDARDKLYQEYSGRPDPSRTVNPRFEVNGVAKYASVLIKNATIWTSDHNHTVLHGYDLLVKNGVIIQISKGIEAPSDRTLCVFASGKVVTAGLIDMHSHAGLESWPGLDATEDLTEISNPLTPYSRTLDALNIRDEAIRLIMQGGVTTSLVIPGSANIIGGFGYPIKHSYPKSGETADILFNAGVDELGDRTHTPWMYMKMACGENPKRFYGSRKVAPTSRQGSAHLLRGALEKAYRLKVAQDDYCSKLSRDPHNVDSLFPEDEDLDQLVYLLRGWVRLNIHCYEPQDLESMVRTFTKYNVSIRAFHHALEAYRVPNLLKRHNIGVATFSDNWGYKKEAYDASVRAPSILAQHGIPVALKSDHPVINAQFLMHEAAKARHYGFPSKLAVAAVTSVPAKLLGIADRVGSIAVGMDADFVIWDRNPLAIAAEPERVFIDGVQTYKKASDEPLNRDVLGTEIPQDLDPSKRWKSKIELCSLTLASSSFSRVKYSCERHDQLDVDGRSGERELYPVDALFVYNVSRLYVSATQEYSGDAYVLVLNSTVKSYGNSSASVAMNSSVVSLQRVLSVNLMGGVLIPGMVAAGTQLGLVEIPAEQSTGDIKQSDAGATLVELSTRAREPFIFHRSDPWDTKGVNREGVRTGAGGGSAMMEACFKNGIVAAISTHPESIVSNMQFSYTGMYGKELYEGYPRARYRISQEALSQVSGTVTLSNVIEHMERESGFSSTISVNSPELIARLFDRAIKYRRRGPIYGGQGLYELLTGDSHFQRVWNVSGSPLVVIQPPRCTPSTWETRQCNQRSAELLVQKFKGQDSSASVVTRVGIAMDDVSHTRSIGFEASAAYHRANGNITGSDALGLVTWNIGQYYYSGTINYIPNFVGFDRDLILDGLEARVQFVMSGTRVLLSPYQV